MNEPMKVQVEISPIEGFRIFETHHCVTGSMMHIYLFNQHALSEEMLLGLGAGVGFFYWQMKGQLPMLLGRGNVHRPGVDGLEIDVGRRTGVHVERSRTKSAKKAKSTLIKTIERNQPLMIHVDMGFLPYFDLPDDYHFGQHVVVVAGMDPAGQNVLLADRDGEFHPVSIAVLARARGSTYKPFPPMNTWYEYDFSEKRPPSKTEIWSAIADVCQNMLHGPISNLGVRGIHRAAAAIMDWPKVLDESQLRETAFNSYIFIVAQGGTGGGMFRYMYSRFLLEAASICRQKVLEKLSEDLKKVGDDWQDVAEIFNLVYTAEDPQVILPTLPEPLVAIAHQEELIWTQLEQLSAAHA